MTETQRWLFQHADAAYAAFTAKSVPTAAAETIIGVRLPLLRKYAGQWRKDAGAEAFLMQLPHTYYEENLLHAILLTTVTDYERCLEQVERFLPYVDNWAVCDTLRPKIFTKERERLLDCVRRWIASPETYTSRFGMEMLMLHYLEENFRPEYLEWPIVRSDSEYYVRMMAAWFYATALAKQWESVIPILAGQRLPEWTHNKTIQKACESFRITEEQKKYLRTLRRHTGGYGR